MSCVDSVYCTIRRVNRTSFSRQKGNTPFVFIHRQIASFFKNCLQHDTKQLFNVTLKL